MGCRESGQEETGGYNTGPGREHGGWWKGVGLVVHGRQEMEIVYLGLRGPGDGAKSRLRGREAGGELGAWVGRDYLIVGYLIEVLCIRKGRGSV